MSCSLNSESTTCNHADLWLMGSFWCYGRCVRTNEYLCFQLCDVIYYDELCLFASSRSVTAPALVVILILRNNMSQHLGMKRTEELKCWIEAVRFWLIKSLIAMRLTENCCAFIYIHTVYINTFHSIVIRLWISWMSWLTFFLPWFQSESLNIWYLPILKLIWCLYSPNMCLTIQNDSC